MLKSYASALLNLLICRLCFVCRKKIYQGYLCAQCTSTITYLWPPLCRYCAKPLNNKLHDTCASCADKTYPFDLMLSVTAYQEPMISLLHLFKYQHYDYLSELFSGITIAYLERLGHMWFEYDCILPIPIHRHKLKTRGYNQAGLLAQALSKYFRIPYRNDIIKAVANKPSQTKLSPDKRRANVGNAFIASAEAAAKKIILVDDILTTGATAYACAETLQQKGAKTITVITLSKTL